MESYVSSTLHHPLPAGQPLWEVHLIEGYNGSGSALISRIHHCIADGIALTRVMMSLTDDPNEAALADVDDAPTQDQRRGTACAGRSGPSASSVTWSTRAGPSTSHTTSHPPGALW